MPTHIEPHELPDALGMKALPVANLVRTGRWAHPEGFVLRELEPFRKKVASQQGNDDFVVEAYLTTDEEAVLLVARPRGAAPPA